MKKAWSISDQLSAFQSPVSDETLICDVLKDWAPNIILLRVLLKHEIHLWVLVNYIHSYWVKKHTFDWTLLLLGLPHHPLRIMCMLDVAAMVIGEAVDIEETSSYGRSASSFYAGRHASSSIAITCYNCNGSGHVSWKCPSPRPTPQANVVCTKPDFTQAWTVDFGANYHLVANKENITRPVPVLDNTTLTIADGKTLPILSRGSSITSINGRSFALNDISYSLAIINNLLSVSAFTSQNNASVEFFSNTYFVKDIPTRQVLYQD